jgi:hypothetical protein
MDLGHTPSADIGRVATISSCERYRYSLRRAWLFRPDYRERLVAEGVIPDRAGGALVFVMSNPSTADAAKDDATVRRLIGFARLWGWDGFAVVNLFAWRATEPRALHSAFQAGTDIVGLYNDASVREVVEGASRVVCAWGRQPKMLQWREAETRRILAWCAPADCEVVRFDVTGPDLVRRNFPSHPLRLDRFTPLTPMTAHGRTICRLCGVLVAECPCTDHKKETALAVCDACRDKPSTAPLAPMAQ